MNLEGDSMQNIFKDAYRKKIVLFGAGGLAIDYIRKYGGLFSPVFIVDNDATKWNTTIWNIPIKEPMILQTLDKNDLLLIICMKNYSEVLNQLSDMNFEEYYIYEEKTDYIEVLQNSDYSRYLPKYKVGYVPGVYDLYHIGHLNLLKKSKARCEYLIVGVLTDELVYHFKKKYPYIPFEERFAIIESIKYVDRVVKVDFSNTIKLDAWKQLHFDCHFSGDDHLKDWDVAMKQLRGVGANMEFFSYTKTTSSTQIKEKLKN